MPRESKFTKRINIFLSPDEFEKIKSEADDMGVSVSAFFRIKASNISNRGSWIHHEKYLECSECNILLHDVIMEDFSGRGPKYCPNCGVYMKK